jgi:hypothetical protein
MQLHNCHTNPPEASRDAASAQEPNEESSVPIPVEDWHDLLTLLYGAWEDTGLLEEEEVTLARMERNRDEYTEDAIQQVAARVDWMHDFYQRVVLPRSQAQNPERSAV